MDQRDRFFKQTGRLVPQAATSPLRNAPVGPASHEALEAVVGRVQQAVVLLEPRIELLLLACLEAGLPVPGVEPWPPRHVPPPNAPQILIYLRSTCRREPVIARSIQVAIFRLYDAQQALREAVAVQAHATVPAALTEQLRLKLFYLMHLHEDFKDEPVLAQIFPAPRAAPRPADAAPSPVGAGGPDREAELLQKVETLLEKLAGPMQSIRLVLDLLARKGLDVKTLLDPETRSARVIALCLARDPEAVALLRGGLDQYGRASQAARTLAGTGDLEALRELMLPLSQLSSQCRAHPLLRELFPVL